MRFLPYLSIQRLFSQCLPDSFSLLNNHFWFEVNLLCRNLHLLVILIFKLVVLGLILVLLSNTYRNLELIILVLELPLPHQSCPNFIIIRIPLLNEV